MWKFFHERTSQCHTELSPKRRVRATRYRSHSLRLLSGAVSFAEARQDDRRRTSGKMIEIFDAAAIWEMSARRDIAERLGCTRIVQFRFIDSPFLSFNLLVKHTALH